MFSNSRTSTCEFEKATYNYFDIRVNRTSYELSFWRKLCASARDDAKAECVSLTSERSSKKFSAILKPFRIYHSVIFFNKNA